MEGGEPWSQQAAWQALLALRPRLRRFACGLTGSLDEADDLVQAVYERAVERHWQWEPGTRFHSWVFKIAHSIWISRQAAGRGARRARRAGRSGHAGRAATGSGTVEARLALADVRRLVAALPPEQRAALMLVAVDGLSYADAADVLGVPAGTVASRVARARLALDEAIEGKEVAAGGRGAGAGKERVDDEAGSMPATLVAYLDGELDAGGRAARSRRRWRATPSSAQLASLKRVDAALDAAFDPILEAPLPALGPDRATAGRAAPGDGHGLATATRLAWAAGIGGLIVGFAAGQLGPSLLRPSQPVAVGRDRGRSCPRSWRASSAAPRSPSTIRSRACPGTVRPISTFVNADGSYCRAYEARAADEEGSLTSRGVACRDEDGRWLTRVQVNAV